MIKLIDFLDNTLLEKIPQGFVTETHSNKTHEQLSIHKKLVINNCVTVITKGNELESVSIGHISGDECLIQTPEELLELEQILHIIREALFAYDDYQKAYKRSNQKLHGKEEK